MAKLQSWPQRVTVGNVTVTVYEVNHPSNATGKAYVLTFRTLTGRKTIKFANPKAALTEARLRATKLQAGQVEAAEMTGGDRSELIAARKLTGGDHLLSALREWADARKIAGGDLLAAARFYADHQKSGTRRTVTVAEAVDRFLKAKRAEGVDIKASYLKVLPRLKEGILGALPIDKVGRDQLADWIGTAYAAGTKDMAHPGTFNTVRRRFVTLWRWAREEGYLPKLARVAPEEIRARRDLGKDEPIGIMSIAGFRSALDLIRNESPDLLATLVVGGFCGLRRSEIMAQRWADVDLGRGLMRVSKAKTRTPARRLVPICPAAREWLLLCDRAGDHLGPGWGVDRARAQIKAAGIDCPKNAWRHSYITYRCAATGSVDTTAQEAGNSPKVVFAHYRELVSPEDGKAWFEISPSAYAVVVPMVAAKEGRRA